MFWMVLSPHGVTGDDGVAPWLGTPQWLRIFQAMIFQAIHDMDNLWIIYGAEPEMDMDESHDESHVNRNLAFGFCSFWGSH